MLFGVAHKNRITIPEVDRGLVFGLWGLHRPRRRPDPSPPPATDNRELADNRQEVSENPPGTFVKPSGDVPGLEFVRKSKNPLFETTNTSTNV